MKNYQNDRGHRFLFALVRRHPVASIFSLWVTLMMLAGVSTLTLLHTEVTSVPKPAPDAPTQLVPLEVQTEPVGKAAPLLSFGAIALSCTLGCLALSHWLQPAPRLSQPRHSRSTALGRGAASFEESTHQEDSPSASTPVTVLSSEQSHPLDWDEPSLADSLDIRQRRPLSHWL